MKMFRRISALALAVVMICLLSASALAATYTDTITRDGGEMLIYADIDKTSVAADSFLNTEDAVGNQLSISISYFYYVTEADKLADNWEGEITSSSSEGTWECSTAYAPRNIYEMDFALYSFYGEFITYAGTQICDPEIIDLYYNG